jgi:prepilin-type N-terminal cleavage/methylation domain-containing protein
MKPDMQRERGVTLVELVIVTVVIAILAMVMGPLAMQSLRAYNSTLGSVVALDKLRYANERLAREIRAVDFVPGTGFSFVTMGANSMRFTRTLYDAAGAATTDTVTVGNTGTALTIAYAALPLVGPQVLTDELNGTAGLSFTYFDSAGVVTANPNLVRMVQISLSLAHNGSIYPQSTLIQLKNIN